MFRSLAIVESQLLAVYVRECALNIKVSLAAGVAKLLYVFTAALDFMFANSAQTDQGCEIANKVVTAMFFLLQPFRLLLNRCRCEAPNCKCMHIVPYL